MKIIHRKIIRRNLNKSSDESSNETKMSHNDENIYAALKKEIRLLELEIKSMKNGIIAMLKLQIHQTFIS